jgi:hypothetical protein
MVDPDAIQSLTSTVFNKQELLSVRFCSQVTECLYTYWWDCRENSTNKHIEIVIYRIPVHNVGASSHGRTSCNKIAHINPLPQTRASSGPISGLQNACKHIYEIVEKTPQTNTLRWQAIECMYTMSELLHMEELTAIRSLASTLFHKQELLYVRFYLRATECLYTYLWDCREKWITDREIGFFALLLRIDGFFPEEEEEGWDVVPRADFLSRQRFQGRRFCRTVIVAPLMLCEKCALVLLLQQISPCGKGRKGVKL